MTHARRKLPDVHLRSVPILVTGWTAILVASGCGAGRGEHQHEGSGSRAVGGGLAAATFKTRGAARARKMRPRAFGDRLHLPYDQLGMTTDRRLAGGRRARVRCATCHRLVAPKRRNELTISLTGFHRGIELVHGDQTCRTCHNPPLFQDFQLGSGRTIAYSQVMRLCGQCHSGQLRDYRHGAHGGMTGYWDLDRGPRDRNVCIDCHNPHRPAMPRVRPAPRARYRFAE